MNKLSCIRTAALTIGIVLSDDVANELLSIYGKGYVDEIKFKDEMIELKLVYFSGKYIISDIGDSIIENAATLFSDSLPKKERANRKRPISTEMYEISNLCEKLFKDKVVLKPVIENRSNIELLFKKRALGLSGLIIMNAGYIRLVVYKPENEIISKFENIGMVTKHGKSQSYLDIATSHDSLVLVVNTILTHLGI